MKKISLSLALVVAATMVFSCSRNEVPVQKEEQGYVFNVVREGLGSEVSKSTIANDENGRYILFENGDQAGLIIRPESGSATGAFGKLYSADPTNTQLYVSSSIAEGSTVYFYFPYAGTKHTTYEACPLSIPVRQTSNSAGFDSDAMPLVGKPLEIGEALSKSADTAVFYYNLGALIKFSVYTTNDAYSSEQVKSVTFNANDKLAGSFTYNLAGVDGSSFDDLAMSESSVITVLDELAAVGSGKDNGAELFMVVAPGTYSGEFIVTTDAAEYSYDLADAKDFQRSKLKSVSFDLKNGKRTAQELAEYETVVLSEQEGDKYENALTSDDGYFVIEYASNEKNKDIWSFSAKYGAYGSGYIGGTRYAADAYLVSPIFDLSGYTSVTLSFSHAGRYFGTPYSDYAKLLIRVQDDSGEWGDWEELTINTYFGNTSWTYVDNTTDLSAYAGKTVQLAFEYISGGTSSDTGTWEIEKFKLSGSNASDPDPDPEPVEGSTVTFTPTSADDITTDGITISYGAGTNTSSSPAWNSNSNHLRLYANNTITISSSSVKITKIVYSFKKQGKKAVASASVTSPTDGKYTSWTTAPTTDTAQSATWEGSASEIVLTLGSSGQLVLVSAEVTFE